MVSRFFAEHVMSAMRFLAMLRMTGSEWLRITGSEGLRIAWENAE